MIVLAPPLFSTWLCGAHATGTLVALSATVLFLVLCCADQQRRLEGAAICATVFALWCLAPEPLRKRVRDGAYRAYVAADQSLEWGVTHAVLRTVTTAIKPVILLLAAFLGCTMWGHAKPEIECAGCERGGFFYTCREGTGRGSPTCDAFKRQLQDMDEAYRHFEKVMETVNLTVRAVMRTIQNLLALPPKVMRAVDTLFDSRFPGIKLPPADVSMGSCSLFGADPCKMLEAPIEAALRGVLGIFESLANAMTGVFNNVLRQVVTPATKSLRDCFVDLFQQMRKSIKTFDVTKPLFVELNRLVALLQQMDLYLAFSIFVEPVIVRALGRFRILYWVMPDVASWVLLAAACYAVCILSNVLFAAYIGVRAAMALAAF